MAVSRGVGESFADQAFEAAARAYMGAPEGWERRVQAAIAALFDFLVDRPEQTRTCVVAEGAAGPDALTRRDSVIDRFAGLLRPGFAAARTPPPPVVAEAIGGGIYELVRTHVLERRLDELPRAVPDATLVALSPFVGAVGAMETQQSPTLPST